MLCITGSILNRDYVNPSSALQPSKCRSHEFHALRRDVQTQVDIIRTNLSLRCKQLQNRLRNDTFGVADSDFPTTIAVSELALSF